MGILIGLFCIGLGLVYLRKPKSIWELQHWTSVKGGEPTAFYIWSTRIAGVLLIIAGLYEFYTFFA